MALKPLKTLGKFGVLGSETFKNHRKMKVSGARSAPEKLEVQESKSFGNIRKIKHFRRAKRAGFSGFWGPTTLGKIKRIKPFGGLGEAWAGEAKPGPALESIKKSPESIKKLLARPRQIAPQRSL